MAADATIRPAHGGYQDAFEGSNALPIAREIAAQHHERNPLDKGQCELGPLIRAGRFDDQDSVQLVLRTLRWRFYAQPDFRAAVTR